MFRVLTNGKITVLTPRQLAEILVAKSISPDPDAKKMQAAQVPLAQSIAQQLEDRGLLRESNPLRLLAVGIGVGYYLNTFLRKNEVEIQEQTEDAP
jgi:hypothetical protein